MIEKWKGIENFPDYEISNRGNIKKILDLLISKIKNKKNWNCYEI